MAPHIEIIIADITTLDVDAVVNAANSSLLGGGGVDGAIHSKAGPLLLAECKGLNGCQPGEAKLTKGYNLPARFVIHTVGPMWHGGNSGEADTLANCYRNALHLARCQGLRSLAFPSISTGVYGYPRDQAAQLAVKTVLAAAHHDEAFERIIFCCFDEVAADLHRQALDKQINLKD